VDPIPNLGGVAWEALHGTYGPAQDVPARINSLRSPASGVRQGALNALWTAVVHQGTRWQVSAHVVPFLVWLIDDPATAGRSDLVTLLRHVGVGPRDDRDLPFDPEAAFTRFGARLVTKEQEAMVIERTYYLQEDFADDWIDAVNACAEKWDADAYWATAAHVTTYRRWIDDGDPQVASQAAELLAWFTPDDTTITTLLAAGRDASVRVSANLALAHLDLPCAAIVDQMTSLLDHDEAAVRISAAIALAYQAGQDLPTRALDILIDAKDRQPLPQFPPGWQQRAQRGYVALALQRLALS
jgi:hypothetical protein